VKLDPMAHNNDPATSHEAAQKHVRSGKRGAHCEIVLGLVQRHPGSTAVELFYLADVAERVQLKEPQEVRRRLTDLCHTGKVKQGEHRLCRRRNTKMVTWEVVRGTGS
jgi:hypothetical protein